MVEVARVECRGLFHVQNSTKLTEVILTICCHHKQGGWTTHTYHALIFESVGQRAKSRSCIGSCVASGYCIGDA
jgi:hypothetical protein